MRDPDGSHAIDAYIYWGGIAIVVGLIIGVILVDRGIELPLMPHAATCGLPCETPRDAGAKQPREEKGEDHGQAQ